MSIYLSSLLVYILLNLIVMTAYAWDKHKAIEGKWRTRESTLLILGLIGPWGAVAGMRLFHHKTQKPKFKMNYFFLFIHIMVVVLIVYSALS